MITNIATPRLLKIGGGAVKEITKVLGTLQANRPLIVTDPFMVDSGKITAVTDPLNEAGIAFDVFSQTVPDPTTEIVNAGVEILREGDFDCLIALGGGSPIDTAKAMNILYVIGGVMRDHKVPSQPNDPVLPLIAIPTTAGTGSEATKVVVITDTATDEKMLIMGLSCLPAAALVDYTLTFSVPFRTTADTGIDSLTHAIEAYVSKKASPYTDALALSAMKHITANIRTACREPDNAGAREHMMLGATQAGLAFSNASVCLVHGMSRPIGAFFHVPHGLSNAMLLPAVTAYSAPAALTRYADCARTMGVVPGDAKNQLAVNRLVDALVTLNRDLEVPTPKTYGIDATQYFDLLPKMAEQALESGSPNNNPRIADKAEIINLYKKAWA